MLSYFFAKLFFGKFDFIIVSYVTFEIRGTFYLVCVSCYTKLQ